MKKLREGNDMAEVTSDRFCVICENIVPREETGVPIKVSPSSTVLLHDGCAKKAYMAYKSEMARREKEERDEI